MCAQAHKHTLHHFQNRHGFKQILLRFFFFFWIQYRKKNWITNVHCSSYMTFGFYSYFDILKVNVMTTNNNGQIWHRHVVRSVLQLVRDEKRKVCIVPMDDIYKMVIKCNHLLTINSLLLFKTTHTRGWRERDGDAHTKL